LPKKKGTYESRCNPLLLTCCGAASTSPPPPVDDSETEPESDEEDYEVIMQETDQDRRRLMDGMDRQELESMKTVGPSQRTSGKNEISPRKGDILQVSDDEDEPRPGNLLDYFGIDLEEIRRDARQGLQDNKRCEHETSKLSISVPEPGKWACVVCTL
jgi:hypothetical protein